MGQKVKKTSPLVRDCIYGKVGFQVDELTRAMDQFESSVLFGQIQAKKYIQSFGYERMAIFLREPVARTISAYLHNKRHADFNGSVIDFCSSAQGINRQSFFLKGVDISKFGFVGITEYYERSLVNFSSFSGIAVKNLRINVGDNYPDYFTEEELDSVRQSNQLDLELYKNALEAFEAQSGKIPHSI